MGTGSRAVKYARVRGLMRRACGCAVQLSRVNAGTCWKLSGKR